MSVAVQQQGFFFCPQSLRGIEASTARQDMAGRFCDVRSAVTCGVAIGKKLPFRDVDHPVATEGKPDIGRRAGFGRDGPIPEVARFQVAVQHAGFGPMPGARVR